MSWFTILRLCLYRYFCSNYVKFKFLYFKTWKRREKSVFFNIHLIVFKENDYLTINITFKQHHHTMERGIPQHWLKVLTLEILLLWYSRIYSSYVFYLHYWDKNWIFSIQTKTLYTCSITTTHLCRVKIYVNGTYDKACVDTRSSHSLAHWVTVF